MSRIRLRGVSHDPFQGAERTAEAPLRERYLLIESHEAWGPAHWRSLASVGVTCIERVGDYVYLCVGRNVDLPTIEALDFVAGAAPYSREFKLASQLESARLASRGFGMALDEPSRVRVDVALHTGGNAADVAEFLSDEDVESLQLGTSKLRVTTTPEVAKRVSELEFVRRVEPASEYEYCSNVACDLVHASEVHRALELRGEGEIVVVCDSGLDLGKVGDVHPAFAGRVVKLIPLGRKRFSSDPNGHGTHVAGLAVGDRQPTEVGGEAITGTAPGAGLIMQSVYKGIGAELGGIPPDLHDLFEPVYTNFDARIHNNSWVQSLEDFGSYSEHCRELDDFVHHHRDLVVVCATGNEGRPDGVVAGRLRDGTVQPPATAKNCVSVGACENERPEESKRWKDQGVWEGSFDDDEVISEDGWSDDGRQVAPFSGRGPTEHGRIKPDLVAPGTVLLGPCSRRLGNNLSLWGESEDDSYRFLGGTSMAAPIVAGCAAVVRQFLRAELGRSPSAALVKAVLINAADDLGGIPNYSEGWGRVNLARAVKTELPDRVEFHDEGAVLTTEPTTLHKQCLEGGRPLKVTLVWTDPPGEKLQSDLELVVEIDGVPERSSREDLKARGFEPRNNVQQIVWDDFPLGPFRILVKPHATLEGGQRFALVVRGGI